MACTATWQLTTHNLEWNHERMVDQCSSIWVGLDRPGFCLLFHGRSSNHAGLDCDDDLAIVVPASEVTGIKTWKKNSWFLLWHDGFHFLLHVLCIAAWQTQESTMCWLKLASVPFQQEMMDIEGGHSDIPTFWMRCPASTRHNHLQIKLQHCVKVIIWVPTRKVLIPTVRTSRHATGKSWLSWGYSLAIVVMKWLK